MTGAMNKPRFHGERVRLEEVCIKGKSSLRQKDVMLEGPYPVYGASGIVGYLPSYQNGAPYVAVVKDGAGVGRACRCKGESSVLGTMQALIPSNDVDCSFLFHLVRSLRLGSGFSGSTIPHIYFKDYGKRIVHLPDLNGQRTIAAILDGVESIVAIRERYLAKLDDLRKSRFIEMFGGIEEREYVQLKEVCSIITDGTHQSPKFTPDGVPFLFVSNIAHDRLTYETDKYISAKDYQELIKRTPVEVGDVLISAVGSFGHPAIVKTEKPFCFQRHIAYLKPIREKVVSEYLHAALLSEDAQEYMDRSAKGVAQRTVTLKSFKELSIPVPPFSLQQEFSAFVRQVDKLESAARASIDRLQTLYDSLAQEYFG